MDWTLLGFQGLRQVANVHPVFVHFPIALFPAALLCYGVGIARRRAGWLFAGRCCLCLAVLGAGVAVLTGELGEETFPHTDAVHKLIETHEAIGIGTLVGGAILAAWSFCRCDGVPRGRIGFLLLLALATLGVLQGGDLGSRMVFMHGAAVRPVIEQLKAAPPIHRHQE